MPTARHLFDERLFDEAEFDARLTFPLPVSMTASQTVSAWINTITGTTSRVTLPAISVVSVTLTAFPNVVLFAVSSVSATFIKEVGKVFGVLVQVIPQTLLTPRPSFVSVGKNLELGIFASMRAIRAKIRLKR